MFSQPKMLMNWELTNSFISIWNLCPSKIFVKPQMIFFLMIMHMMARSHGNRVSSNRAQNVSYGWSRRIWRPKKAQTTWAFLKSRSAVTSNSWIRHWCSRIQFDRSPGQWATVARRRPQRRQRLLGVTAQPLIDFTPWLAPAEVISTVSV